MDLLSTVPHRLCRHLRRSKHGWVAGALLLFVAMAFAPVRAGAQQSVAVPRPAVVSLNGVVSVDSSDAWAVGFTASGSSSETLVEHWDGSTWTVIASPNPGKGLLNRLDAVYATGPDNVWAVGSYNNLQDGRLHNLAMHWDGQAWTVESPKDPPHQVNGLLSVSGSAGDDVWAGGYTVNEKAKTLATLFHWDGNTWSPFHLIHGPIGDPVDGLARIGSRYWATGPCSGGCESAGWRGMVAELAGDGKWNDMPTPNLGHTADIDGTATDDVWVVGDGMVSRFDGSSWHRLPRPGIGLLRAVATPSAGLTMVLGPEVAAVWDGSSWQAVSTPRVGQLLDLSLDSDSSGWAVGTTGRSALLERWDGREFQRYLPDGGFAATGARAGSARPVCYTNLFDDNGAAMFSQQSSDDAGSDSAGAAGFTVSKSCVIRLVEALGAYGPLHGPAKSETVTFYAADDGVPGAVIDRQTVHGADFQGHFWIPTHAVRLDAGQYFVSVVANMRVLVHGGWAWTLTNHVSGDVDQWENPGGALSDCVTWSGVGSCGIVGGRLDFMAALYR